MNICKQLKSQCVFDDRELSRISNVCRLHVQESVLLVVHRLLRMIVLWFIVLCHLVTCDSDHMSC